MFSYFLIDISLVRSQIYSKGSNHSLVLVEIFIKSKQKYMHMPVVSMNRRNRICFGHEDTTPEKIIPLFSGTCISGIIVDDDNNNNA